MRFMNCLKALAVVAATLVPASSALADAASMRDDFVGKVQGKKVIFVPIAMSFATPVGWATLMEAQARRMGYTFEVRDPSFSVETAAQAINQAIADQPDIIVVQALDATAFNRLVKKAQDAGILWIWANVRGSVDGDAFVGADYVDFYARNAEELAKMCGEGTSGKVAEILSAPNAQNTKDGVRGWKTVWEKYPNIQVVASQTAEADASKAKAIASTIIKQNPDLCGFVGMWDGQDVGVVAAVKEAGMTGKIKVVTSGDGTQPNCDKVADGSFDVFQSEMNPYQGTALNMIIQMFLQNKPTPGSQNFTIYTPSQVIRKDNLSATSCWDLDEMKRLNAAAN